MRLFGLAACVLLCIGTMGCCDDGVSRETGFPRPAHARARLGRYFERDSQRMCTSAPTASGAWGSLSVCKAEVSCNRVRSVPFELPCQSTQLTRNYSQPCSLSWTRSCPGHDGLAHSQLEGRREGVQRRQGAQQQQLLQQEQQRSTL